MKEITLNFGALKDTITRLSSHELLKENDSNTLKQFIKSVRKSPSLMKQNLVFKNIKDCKPFEKERLAERFISQNLNLFKGLNWFDIMKENRELRISLLENSHVESNAGKNDELFNNIQTLIESITRHGFSEVKKEQDAYEFVLKYLTRKDNIQEEKKQETKDNPDFKNWKFITELAVNNFNKRYSHLTEQEKKLLKMLLSEGDKKKNYIEDLKNENLSTINNLLSNIKEPEKTKLLKDFKIKLEKGEYNNASNLDDFLVAYSELKEVLFEL